LVNASKLLAPSKRLDVLKYSILTDLELNLQQTINICRVEEKRKLFPDDDPFFSTNQSTVDQSGWNEEPPKKRAKGRRKLEQR
jgi:hypothetical protein